MQSTHSSPERRDSNRSATEDLASRYRHLFVLPSGPTMLILAAAGTLILVLRSGRGLLTFLPAYAVFVLSALAVSSALQVGEKKSIASFRRVTATLFSGTVFWLICVGAGWVALALGFQGAIENSVVFGAFAAAGIIFLIVNGAFSRRSVLSLALAAVYPLSTLLLVAGPGFPYVVDPAALLGGAGSFLVVSSFVALLSRKKTSMGHDALHLFRAFMKTWVAGAPDELESIIADHSEDASVTTKVLRFETEAGNYFVVLPGVHPGPFHPIGSYDLPGEVAKAFGGLGKTLTLHRPGGHERNLATRAITAEFAHEIAEFAKGVPVGPGGASMRGPVAVTVGKASAGALAFSDDALLTISFAPLGSDDLSSESEKALTGVGSGSGFDTSVVDAHNSIDLRQETPELGDPGWKALFERLRGEVPEKFRLAYSHSSELGFGAGEDLTENGVGLLMFEAGGTKQVLVLADANNAVPPLRAKVAEALSGSGYSLIEVCTSDSHNLAALGLTVARGYKALGEATPVEKISRLIVAMAKVAEGRLGPAAYGSGKLTSEVRVFGAKALDEFAKITQTSSELGRNYFRVATAAVAGLLVLSVLL